MEILVGVGRENITPELGALLFGYNGSMDSRTVHDDLTVTAAAFQYGEVKAMIISASLCLINTELSDEIRELAGNAAGILPENIILAATHTHSGPSVQNYEGWGVVNRDYCDNILIPQCVKAARKAADSMKPSRFGVGAAESRIGVNRRQFIKDGRIMLGQNPWGVYDPTMTVAAFKGLDGSPIVNIVHYGAHCTAHGANHEISRDWSGVMTDRLEKESGAVTLFINGAQGDTGPRLSNGGTVGAPEYTAEIGFLAAVDAIKIYKSIRTYRDTDCAILSGEIRIPFEPLMALDEAQRLLSGYESVPEHNLGRRIYMTLCEIVDLHKYGESSKSDFVMKQSFIRIGNTVFAPLPFEVFSEISLRLRAFASYENVLLIGCANGDNSYLPTQDQLCRGGYEVDMFLWNHPHRLPDDADSRIVNAYLKIMQT